MSFQPPHLGSKTGLLYHLYLHYSCYASFKDHQSTRAILPHCQPGSLGYRDTVAQALGIITKSGVETNRQFVYYHARKEERKETNYSSHFPSSLQFTTR